MATVSEQRLAALMFTDIVGSVALQNKLGTEAYTRFIARHDEIFKQCLSHAESGEILNETGDGFLVKFETPKEAVNTALRLQMAMHEEVCEGEPMRLCIGLNMGSVTEMEEGVRGEKRAVGMAINLAARVMDLAEDGQILMTRAVFDEARQFVRQHPQQESLPEETVLQWPAHGRYLFKGNEDPLEIYEVGVDSLAPLSPPEGGGKAKRAVAADEEDTLGWRPGAGIPIPRMEDWVIEEKLGSGGFGEVWLAKHISTKEGRVFKFCFDPERLRSFRRELTLFRLLRDALGKRDDIAALYDVSIEMPPFYLESEFVPNGNLAIWVEKQGGLGNVSEATKIDLLARTARAVDAAHSVGIVHKDIKPSNVLIAEQNGQPRPRLADFGIGAVTDSSALSDFGITQLGFTQSIVSDSDSGTQSMTQLYAPPEYLVGAAAHPRGDIYSLGVMLFQMIVGNLKRPLASGWRRDVPELLLAEIIEKCIDVEPDRRFETAGQLAERLETLEERREQLAERQRLEELRIQARKRRRFLMVGGLVCLGLFGLVCYFAESYMRQKELTEETKALENRAKKMASQSDLLLAGHLSEKDRKAEAVAHLARALRSDPNNRAAAAKLMTTLAYDRFESPVYPVLHTDDNDDKNRFFIGGADAACERFLGLDPEGTLTLFDLKTGDRLGEPFHTPDEIIRDAYFVEEDTRVLAVVLKKGVSWRDAPARLRLWDIDSRRLLRQEPQGEDSKFRHIGLPSDGSHWLSHSYQEFQYWDLSHSEWNVHHIPKPEGDLEFFEKASGEDVFAALTESEDGRQHIQLLNVTGDPSQWNQAEWITIDTLEPWTLQGYRTDPVLSVDGRWLAVPESDRSVKVYDLKTGQLAISIPAGDAKAVLTIAFSPDSMRIGIGYFNTGRSEARVWDLVEMKPLPLHGRHRSGVTGITFDETGSRIITSSMDRSVRLWDVDSGISLTEPMLGHTSWSVYSAFAPRGGLAYTVGIDGTACVWDLRGHAARPTPVLATSYEWLIGVDGSAIGDVRPRRADLWRPDGTSIAQVPLESKEIACWPVTKDLFIVQRQLITFERRNLATGSVEEFELKSAGPLFPGSINHDGTALITSHYVAPNAFLYWRLTSEKPEPVTLSLGPGRRALLARLSGDGRRASTSSFNDVLLWDLEEEVPKPRVFTDAGFVFGHTLNRDGTRLLTGTMEGNVRVWDFDTLEPVTQAFMQPGQVVAVDFSTDERLIAGLALDIINGLEVATVAVWDLETEQQVMAPIRLPNTRYTGGTGMVHNFRALADVRFSPDDRQIIVSWDLVVSTIDLGPRVGEEGVPNWLPDLAESLGGYELVDGKMTLKKSQPGLLKSDGQEDAVGQWAAWLQQPAHEREISPWSSWSSQDYASYLLRDRTMANMSELLRVEPRHPLALIAQATMVSATQPRRALSFAQLAEEALARVPPDDTRYHGAFRELARVYGRQSSREWGVKALKMVNKALDQDPDDLESRFFAAEILNQLSPDEGNDPTAVAEVAGLLSALMAPLGWGELLSRFDEGISRGGEWAYWDVGQPETQDWQASEFDDTEWERGKAPFGYGDDRESTALYAGERSRRPTTAYFRKKWFIQDLTAYADPVIRFQRDDGLIIYINGRECHRDNMPEGEVTHGTFSMASMNNFEEIKWHEVAIPNGVLQEGENVIAVEVHQQSLTSSDLHFDLELEGNVQLGRGLLSKSPPEIEAKLDAVPHLPESLRRELSALNGTGAPSNAFVALARASRHLLADDVEGVARALAEMPGAPAEVQNWPPNLAKARLLSVLQNGAE